MLKNIISIGSASLLVAVFSACSGDSGNPGSSENELSSLDGVAAQQPSKLQSLEEKKSRLINKTTCFGLIKVSIFN